MASGPNTNPMTAQKTGLAPLFAAILWQTAAQTRDKIKTANTYTGVNPVNLSIGIEEALINPFSGAVGVKKGLKMLIYYL